MTRQFSVLGEFPEGVGEKVISGRVIRPMKCYEANTFQEALESAAQEDGLRLPLNFMEELNAKKNGANIPKKEVGLIYEIMEITKCKNK